MVVPAFTGLGAPYWDMYARGSIFGLTRGSTRAHIARAVLDSIAYQVTDLVRAMAADAPCPMSVLRVDGGASVSDIMMQTQADLLRLGVDRPAQVETTAFGAAALAGLFAVSLAEQRSWNGCAAVNMCFIRSGGDGVRRRLRTVAPSGVPVPRMD